MIKKQKTLNYIKHQKVSNKFVPNKKLLSETFSDLKVIRKKTLLKLNKKTNILQ